MGESIYNPNTADIQTSFEQMGKTKMTQGFASIDDMNLDNIAEQNQTAPRNIRTGELRGDQQVRGLIKVEDRSGRIVMMLGYSPGAF